MSPSAGSWSSSCKSLDEESFTDGAQVGAGIGLLQHEVLEDLVQGGEDEVERYLKGFTKVEDNRYSMKIFLRSASRTAFNSGFTIPNAIAGWMTNPNPFYHILLLPPGLVQPPNTAVFLKHPRDSLLSATCIDYQSADSGTSDEKNACCCTNERCCNICVEIGCLWSPDGNILGYGCSTDKAGTHLKAMRLQCTLLSALTTRRTFRAPMDVSRTPDVKPRITDEFEKLKT
ncbi:hypothetical protein ZWY2020_059961 [Hordeum vulgare]|nr:hypothetical protein ZWY2020_059961 [Hordeum vulgare]